jgi:BASS family bile acid:Na+ symporter
LGILANYVLKEKAEKIAAYTPAFSALAIAGIVAGIIGANGEKIVSSFGLIFLVVVLHNLLGYALGYTIGFFTGMGHKNSITLAVEVGMQNSGLAASLAATQFASMPLVAVPAAIFSTWHNISGSLLAWVLKR